MSKVSKRISSVVGIMLLIAIIVLLIYMEINKRSNREQVEADKAHTEAELLMERDLTSDYPKTPRDVVDYYSAITKSLYSGISDEEINVLAKKVRELCDEEFLEKNPEETYLKDLYSDIAAWNKAERKITNYLIVKDELEEIVELDGREYANIHVSYYIVQKGKTSETRQFLLRKNMDGRWKLLGWEFVEDKDEK